MEKIILKKIVLIALSIFSIGFLISASSFIYIKNKSTEKDLTEMISQIEIASNEINTDVENSINLFK